MEGAQQSGPTGVEVMEVDVGDILLLTSEDTTTVTPKEDEMLTGDPSSVA